MDKDNKKDNIPVNNVEYKCINKVISDDGNFELYTLYNGIDTLRMTQSELQENLLNNNIVVKNASITPSGKLSVSAVPKYNPEKVLELLNGTFRDELGIDKRNKFTLKMHSTSAGYIIENYICKLILKTKYKYSVKVIIENWETDGDIKVTMLAIEGPFDNLVRTTNGVCSTVKYFSSMNEFNKHNVKNMLHQFKTDVLDNLKENDD